jgi:hypothetical protein
LWSTTSGRNSFLITKVSFPDSIVIDCNLNR